jgi:hypothetical protein
MYYSRFIINEKSMKNEIDFDKWVINDFVDISMNYGFIT